MEFELIDNDDGFCIAGCASGFEVGFDWCNETEFISDFDEVEEEGPGGCFRDLNENLVFGVNSVFLVSSDTNRVRT